MKLPFLSKPEPVQDEDLETRNYTDALVNQILASAGELQASAATIALEVGLGAISRAAVMGRIGTLDGRQAVSGSLIAHVLREMVATGQSLLFMDAGAWRSPSSFEVSSSSNNGQTGWLYRLSYGRPDGTTTVIKRGRDVIHARYSYDSARPWAGISPLARCPFGSQLSGNLEQRLSEEAATLAGYILPIPNAQTGSIDKMKADLAGGKGRVAMMETTAAGWGDGRAAAPAQDWQQKRIGADIPDGNVELFNSVQLLVLGALGVPVEVLSPAQGQGQREAWRRFLHGTVAPLGTIFTDELSRVLEKPVSINWDALFASDVQGRARAFQSLVGAGMDITDAAQVSGVLIQDE